MNIFLKTEDEIELMREANLLVGKTLAEVGRHVKPGVTTLQLDSIAEEFIRDNGHRPAGVSRLSAEPWAGPHIILTPPLIRLPR